MKKRSFIVVAVAVGCASATPTPTPTSSASASVSAASSPAASPHVCPCAAAMGGKKPVSAAERLAYPETRRDLVNTRVQGTDVVDAYRWLENGKADDVRTWMTAQDALTRKEIAKVSGRDAIAARLKELLYLDTLSAPTHRGSRYFYSRRHATKEKAVIYWKEGKRGKERVLFDPNTWSQDGSVALRGYTVSWDGKKVAYKVSKNNSDEATLYLMEIATGKKSKIDVIDGAKYGTPAWTPSGDGFYYTWLPVDPAIATADRPGYQEIRFHRLGEDPKRDRIVRERTGNPTIFQNASLSRDGRFLLLSVDHGWTKSDLYVRDLKAPGAPEWRPIAVSRDAIYAAQAYKGTLYVYTNEDAPMGRLFAVDPARLDRAAWREIVPKRKDATLESFDIIGGKLAITYLKDASNRLEIHELDGKLTREVALPAIGTVIGPVGNEDEDEAYFGFVSFTFPLEIHETSIKTGETTLYTRLKVPVDPTPYAVEQLFYRSKDGTRVPMFVVHRKDLRRDGSTPVWLTGYGGFQVALTPFFDPTIYPWLERGGMYVVANLRGGNEYGEAWHRAGMRRNKQNVFDDFIAAAEHLIKERYTRPNKLVIEGRSNGGLLVGAALTQRPDLFRVVICGVPLLDMLRYHLFGSGKTWIEEYGSAEDPEDFKAIHAYSPYHRVRADAKYPAVLLLSADTDDRVDPMHARKFAAALQAASKGGPVLLRIERNAGHGGADLIKSMVETEADAFAFAMKQLGIL